MNRKSQNDRAVLLKALIRQASTQRGLTDDPHGVSIKTVAKLVKDVGEWAEWFLDSLPPIDAGWIQADEMWSFVGAKKKNVKRFKMRRPGVGDWWLFVAQCADTKLIITHHFGKRTVYAATAFFRKLNERLKRKPTGEFNVRPLIVTDGLDAYVEAGAVVFGEDADRAMKIKKQSSVDPETGKPTVLHYCGSELRALTRTRRIPKRKIHTEYVERLFGTLRDMTRRCVRETLAFSKSRRYHELHLAIWIVFYNFCWIPRPSEWADPETGEIKRMKRVPPAMAAGLSDRPWTLFDLLDRSDAFHAAQGSGSGAMASEASVVEQTHPDEARFWVYHAPENYRAMIHRADCSACRAGQGQVHKPGRKGKWYPCETREEARAVARDCEPDRHGECSKCLGEYNIRGRFGRSR